MRRWGSDKPPEISQKVRVEKFAPKFLPTRNPQIFTQSSLSPRLTSGASKFEEKIFSHRDPPGGIAPINRNDSVSKFGLARSLFSELINR